MHAQIGVVTGTNALTPSESATIKATTGPRTRPFFAARAVLSGSTGNAEDLRRNECDSDLKSREPIDVLHCHGHVEPEVRKERQDQHDQHQHKTAVAQRLQGQRRVAHPAHRNDECDQAGETDGNGDGRASGQSATSGRTVMTWTSDASTVLQAAGVSNSPVLSVSPRSAGKNSNGDEAHHAADCPNERDGRQLAVVRSPRQSRAYQVGHRHHGWRMRQTPQRDQSCWRCANS